MLREVALDATGAIMPGALLYSYAAGGTTALTTYSDAALTIANANPIVANSAGLFGPIYLSNAAYRFDLKSAAGVTYFSQDNVYATTYLALQAVQGEQTTTLTGSQNDVALTAGVTELRANNATTLTITSLAAPSPVIDQQVTVFAMGAGTVVLNDQSAALGTAGNRIITGTAASLTLTAGTGYATLLYDTTTARWRVKGSSGLASANGTLATDVTVVSANTWYDGPTVSLVAGTWFVTVSAHIALAASTAQRHGIRISDGTTHYASTGDWSDTTSTRPSALTCSAIIALTATTTMKLQVVSTVGASTVLLKAATIDNSAGNNATQINAIKIA